MFKFLKITCQDANEICNKSQYNEATFLEKVKLNIHLAFCKICALYSKQNAKLSTILKAKAFDCKKHIHCMDKKDKEVLKEKIKELTT